MEKHRYKVTETNVMEIELTEDEVRKYLSLDKEEVLNVDDWEEALSMAIDEKDLVGNYELKIEYLY